MKAVMDYKKLSRIVDMSRINRLETKLFPANSYDIYVNSNDHNPPHLHIISHQEEFDIRADFDGNILSVKHPGRRTNSVADYNDIQRKLKKWLNNKPASSKVSAKFNTNREYAEFEWAD